MDDLIPIVNKIQDVFSKVGLPNQLDLPQIAVVGIQSSGKSSVLENVVGRDFLPRGTGIVTRRPLILQLMNVPEFTIDEEGKREEAIPWGEFLHQPNRRYTDFEAIRDEISEETDRVTGHDKGISPVPIRLKIYSPNVVNLTLVDLPGLTKVPVGDQPADIENLIRGMVLEFITPPSTIILAVTPANMDIANSEALKIAKEVDPNHERTIGVLTKLDLMDKDTDCMPTLQGKVYPLRRGFIGVVNRGQRDINSKLDIKSSLRNEEEFFTKHAAYRGISSRLGTRYLARTLNQILLAHIRDALPALRSQVTELIGQTRHVLGTLGGGTDDMSQSATLLQLITSYSTAVTAAVDGHQDNLSRTELHGGARIHYILTDAFVPYLQAINSTEGLTEEQIHTAVLNAKGTRSGLFTPEVAFEMLIRQQISKLEEPSLRCADMVFDELVTICEEQSGILARFPNLRTQVGEFVLQLLQSYLAPLREHLQNVIHCELAYINTQHPMFFDSGNRVYDLMNPPAAAPTGHPGAAGTGADASGGQRVIDMGTRQPSQAVGTQALAVAAGGDTEVRNAAAQQVLPQTFADVPQVLRNTGRMSTRERREMEFMKQCLAEYFGIVRIQVCDTTQKSVIHFLVNKLKSKLQAELIAALYKEDLFDVLMRESDNITARRQVRLEWRPCIAAWSRGGAPHHLHSPCCEVNVGLLVGIAAVPERSARPALLRHTTVGIWCAGGAMCVFLYAYLSSTTCICI